MLFVKILFAGYIVLLGAILFNIIAGYLKLDSWYEFLKKRKSSPISFIWLFVFYPLGLGVLAFLVSRLFI